MAMKLKSISKYKDGDKSIKVKDTKPTFADKIKPLTPEQKSKGEKINELDKKKKLFKDGGDDIKSTPTTQTGKPKKMSLVTTKTEGSTGSQGTARIKEETMQKNKATGKVELKEGFKDSTNKDRTGQEALRRKALDEANKNIESLPHGHKVTYTGANGKLQHAGTVEKTPGTPAKVATASKKEEFVASTPNKSELSRNVKGKESLVKEKDSHPAAEGWYKKNNVWLNDTKSGNYNKDKPKGTVADAAKKQKQLAKSTFKEGTNKMKLYKKGSKMC